jgi:RHS repeat-associated protein
MKVLRSSIFILAFLGFNAIAFAQAPVCDVTCTPNASLPSYGGAAAARGKPLNARGSAPLIAHTLPLEVPKTDTVVGSQSYNYVIPILSLPGRAGHDLNLNLYYNSRIWDVDTTGGTVTFNADRDFPSYGFRLDFGYLEFLADNTIIMAKGDGTKVTLNNSNWISTDGSNTVYSAGVITYKDGTKVGYEAFPSNANLLRPIWVMDSNGNEIFITYVSGHDQLINVISDSAGRIYGFSYDPSNHHLSSIQEALTPSGWHTFATFLWVNPYPSGSTWYSFSGLTVNGAPTADQMTLLSSCTYANGTGYSFSYGDWGIVNKITHFNALGNAWNYVSYNYPLASAGPLTDAPAFTQETFSPDGSPTNTSVWNYAVSKSGTGVVTSMAVTDPLGNINTTTLNSSGLTSSVQVKDSSSTVLRTTSYVWTGTFSGSTVPSIITTTNDAGQQSQVQYAYDAFDNIKDFYEYDFGPQLKRHTVTTYLTGAYIGTPHIVDLPSQILVKDAAGNTINRTDIAYDGTTLASVVGAVNHDDGGHSASFNTRGNVTSITRYTNAAAGTGPIVRNFSYDSLGNTRNALMDCCNSMAYNFSSTTQYTAPDSIVRGPITGPQFTTSFTYNPDNGDVLTSTDENGQSTQYQYDSMNRPTATLLPAQGGTVVQLNSSYGDSASPLTLTSSTTNAGNTAQTVTTIDGMGHTLQVDNKDGGTTVGSTAYKYDLLWRNAQVSNPFAPGATPVYTTFTYDGLGRATQIAAPSAGYTQLQYSGNSVTITDPSGKIRKNYTDALGRLIEVDEPGWGDAEPGMGTITIGGSEHSVCTIFFNNVCHHTVFDSGSVNLTVNGSTKTATYISTSTTSSVASDLAGFINGDTLFPVTATVSGSSLVLTARASGATTNYSLSSSATTSDPTDFSGPSFGITLPTPASLSGGVGATPQSSPTLTRAFVTTYAYDLLNNLTSAALAATTGPLSGVTHAGQPHSYTYDGLGRLTSSVTPEAGTVTTFYTDAGGNVCAINASLPCRRQDARGILKTLTYDGVNRPLTISYSDTTPGVTFAYDAGGSAAFALGRLTSISENSNSQTYTYDNLGHVKSVTQNIDAVAYPVQYTYNLLGQVATTTYPSGRVATQSYSSIGQMASLASGGTTYLNSLSYNAAGQMLGMTLGNGIQGSFSYNDHQQIAALRYFKSGVTPDPLNLGYDYTSATQLNNNGQIQAVHYFTQPGVEDLTKTELFTYDPWSRLAAAQTGTVNTTTLETWSLTWGYDRLGNRKQQTLVNGDMPGGVGQPNFTMDENTNRITGFSYDGAGNLSGDSAFTYTYDGASRMKQAQQVASPNTITATTYFGQLRIKKVVGSNTTRYIYSGSMPIAEYANGSLSKEYLYAGSSLLATIAGASTTYHHPDHLSIRAETDASGTPINSIGNLPYGDPWYGTSVDQFKFGNYVRDNSSGETGLDYAQARFYSTAMGRFMNEDPIGGMLSTPQSLNSYSYVGGDPVNRTDPTGMYWRGEALCTVIVDSSSKSICAKFGSGGPDGDNELFGVGSIACDGVNITDGQGNVTSNGPTSFCSTAPGCPVFEIFMCDGLGSASSVLGINWTAPPSFGLGPTFTNSPPPLVFSNDPSIKNPTGTNKACTLSTYTEGGCPTLYELTPDQFAAWVISQVSCKCLVDPMSSEGSYGVDDATNRGPMGRSTLNPPAIAPRGPFVAPPLHPPSSRLP